MSDRTPVHPSWHFSPWFGSVVGMTLWMLPTAGIVIAHRVGYGLGILGLYLAANAVAIQLWRRRGRRSIHAAAQPMIIVCGLASIGVIFLVQAAGLWARVQRVGGKMSSAWAFLLVVLMVASLVSFHHFKARRVDGKRDAE